MFLQQRWAYSRGGEYCELRSATMASHVYVPTQQRKENAFTEGRKTLGVLQQNRTMAFHCTSPGQERELFTLLNSVIILRHKSVPFYH